MQSSNYQGWPPQRHHQGWQFQPGVAADQLFTLQQEALETTKRPTEWSTESKLRHNPVSFISAGVENPLEEIEKELATVESNSEISTARVKGAKPTSAEQPSTTHGKELGNVSSSLIQFVDVLQTQAGTPSSPAGSESVESADEEPVLLFKGRKAAVAQTAESFKLDSMAKELGKLDHASSPASQEALSVSLLARGRQFSAVESSAMPPMQVSDGPDMDEEDADIDVEAMARFYSRDIGGSDNEFGLEDQAPPSEVDSDIGIAHSFGSGQPRRLKKAERKKLREQGQLKRPTKDHDLWTKYPTTMKISEVIEETKLFLMSREELVSFPPLAKHHRRMVHEVANRLSLKSKSIGKAETRRPTLHRTKRTPLYSDDWFDSMAGPLIARWSGKKVAGAKRNQGHAKTGYRDGDIVGDGLPELGEENRGRTMLEKMGWSSGTALGAVENKGILHPVAQVVKRTKAGLG